MLSATEPYFFGEMLLRAAAAGVLLFGQGYCTWLIAGRTAAGSRFAIRWLLYAVIFVWLTTVEFHALLWTRSFRLLAALAVTVGAAVVLRIALPPTDRMRSLLRRDRRRLRAFVGMPRGNPEKIIYGLMLVGLAGIAVRALVLPPMGWDSLTYHAVKTGLWVQTGEQYTIQVPGGWTSYRNYPGGAEALIAWAMLPFHSDLLTGAHDWLQMIAVLFAVYALGRELGLRARMAQFTAAYFVALFPISRAVDALYSDTLFTFCFTAAVVLMIRLLSRKETLLLIPLFALFGVAAGIKVTGGLIATLLAGFTACCMLLHHRRFGARRVLAKLGIGVAAAVVVAAPWYLYNMYETGYPLSPVPIRVLGFTLGESTPEMDLYLRAHAVTPHTFGREIYALLSMFKSTLDTPRAGLFALVPCVVFLPALVLLYLRRPLVAVILAFAAITVAASYFQPGFTTVRVLWASTNGRFIMPGLVIALVVSAAVPRWRNDRRLRVILGASAALNFALVTCRGWGPAESFAAPLIVLGVTLLGVLVVGARKRFAGRHVPRIAAAIGVGCLVAALQILRDHVRYSGFDDSKLLLGMATYWIPAAERLDAPPQSNVVAVTVGYHTAADRLLMYPFLGKHLQNKLVYVPITVDGDVVRFGREYRTDEFVTPELWIERVRRSGATHVVSFDPPSQELLWMRERPGVFEPIATGKDWGAYAVK